MSDRVRTKPIAAITLCLAAFLAVPSWGASVRRLGLDQVRDQAVAVFAGEVIGVSQRIGDTGKMVWTDYEIAVDDSFLGESPGAHRVVSFAGGEVGSHSVGIPGVPILGQGEHYLFFIQSGSNHPMPTVGWGQGLYRITNVKLAEGDRTILISVDGEPLELSHRGELMRGRSIRVSDGSITEIQRERGTRVPNPGFEAPDGTITPVPQRETTVSRGPRTFATLDDVRLFVQGRMHAAPELNR